MEQKHLECCSSKSGRTYILTNFGTYSVKIATIGELAAVELYPEFDLCPLMGKSPVEQVQAVFDTRQSWVEGKSGLELKRLDKSTRTKVK